MKLYVDSGFLSPYAMTAFVALREKQIKFDIETLNLAQGALPETPCAAGNGLRGRVI